MIGVILWRDTSDRKAVIWCEDQGDLAFLDRLDDVLEPDRTLDVGDVVRFDLEVRRNVRKADNVTRLLDNWGTTLTDSLTSIPEEPTSVQSDSGAQIIPFDVAASAQGAKRRAIKKRKTG